MKSTFSRIAAATVVAIFIANPAFAAKPEGVGNGNGKGKGNKPNVEKSQKAYKSEGGGNVKGDSSLSGLFFDDRHRNIIRDYYSDEFKRGNCPPGLAKKNNGCLPPGQAKKWQVGHRLPGDVIYHDLPGDLLRRLGHNDPAYKLIRVGSDILKIGVGTGLVVEAVEDLGDLF